MADHIDSVANVQKTARVIRSLIEQFHPRKDVVTTVPLDLLLKAEQAQRMFAAQKVEGADGELAKVGEQVEECVALRSRESATFGAYLRERSR